MHVGVDFDNTIVSYDELFWKLARERDLVPEDVPVSKQEVRDHLRATGREDEWTELQGVGYGSRIGEARAFPGVEAFFVACRATGVQVSIISHKTRHPYRGSKVDLQQAARGWLEAHGFFDEAGIGLEARQVHFELTRQAKFARIAAAGCTVFIDDLVEFLGDADFPAGVRRLLFDPQAAYRGGALERLGSWAEAASLVPTVDGGR